MMSGQRLKSIRFKLPIIENDLSIGLDNGEHVETVVLLSHKKLQRRLLSPLTGTTPAQRSS